MRKLWPAYFAWYILSMKGLVLRFEVHSVIIANFSFKTTTFCMKFKTVGEYYAVSDPPNMHVRATRYAI